MMFVMYLRRLYLTLAPLLLLFAACGGDGGEGLPPEELDQDALFWATPSADGDGGGEVARFAPAPTTVAEVLAAPVVSEEPVGVPLAPEDVTVQSSTTAATAPATAPATTAATTAPTPAPTTAAPTTAPATTAAPTTAAPTTAAPTTATTVPCQECGTTSIEEVVGNPGDDQPVITNHWCPGQPQSSYVTLTIYPDGDATFQGFAYADGVHTPQEIRSALPDPAAAVERALHEWLCLLDLGG